MYRIFKIKFDGITTVLNIIKDIEERKIKGKNIYFSKWFFEIHRHRINFALPEFFIEIITDQIPHEFHAFK